MNIEKVQRHRNKSDWRILTVVLTLALTGLASVAEAVYTLPADRSYPWKGNVGVSGGIPNRTTIYTTLSPNGSNDTTQIQNALRSCPANQVVKLNTGTFRISGVIDWQGVKPGVVLRGDGPTNTKLIFSAGYFYMRTVFDMNSLSTAVNLTTSAAKGATTINVSSVPSWVKVGYLYLISELNDTSLINVNGTEGTPTSIKPGREQNQLVKVAATTATTITFEAPLAYAFTTSQSAQLSGSGYNAVNYAPGYQWGIEDLYMEATYSEGSTHFIRMESCDNCWIKNIDMYNAPGGCDVQTNMSYRTEIRDSSFRYSHQYSGGQGYGLALYNSTFGTLAENNTMVNFHISLEVGGGVGNVFGYNYETKGQSDVGSTAAISHHQVHTYMNLWEGNYVTNKVNADFIHGSSSHNTVFRNRIIGYDGVSTLNQNTVNFAMWNRHWNIVGNILGQSGWHNTYAALAPGTCQDSSKLIYETGYWTAWACGTSGGYDTPTVLDLLTHGNYDVVNNATMWGSGLDQTLPASLYLSGKPAWWGSSQWPAIGPDVSPMYPAIPSGGGKPWGNNTTTKVVLPPPTSLQIN